MTEADVRPYIRTKLFGRRIEAFDTIDSTNIRAKILAEQGAPEGLLVIADEQTAGRGRFGRTWQAEPKKNLTFSVLLKPRIPPDHIGLISLYAALAVTQALRRELSVRCDCKWPNDVLVGGKKICGILSEGLFDGSAISGVIIGIGMNINQAQFPNDLNATATSLALETGRDFDRMEVLASVLGQLEELYALVQAENWDAIRDAWRESTSMFGKEIHIDQQNRIITGTARSLANDGGLIIDINGMEQTIHAGDVTIIH